MTTASRLVAPIRVRADFLAARKGRRSSGPFFFVEARDRDDGGEPRLGLTVTRKVGNAVVRNRIRRRLREAVRVACGADMASGFDYVVVARRAVEDLAFDALKLELSRLLRKAGRGLAGHGDPARAEGSKPARADFGQADAKTG